MHYLNTAPTPARRAANTLLLAPGASRSILAEHGPGQSRRIACCPYGSLPGHSRLAFNGELRGPQGWYHLGNGHRIYNPVLRRFHSPDRLSPFDKGGLNAYAYCLGDPVNATDPTGQFTDFGDFLKGVLFDNPTANFALSFGLLALNLVTAFITTPVTTAAQVAYFSGVGGAITGMTGASVQFAGEREVGRWISIVGTVISGVSVATKVGIGLKSLKAKWPEYVENWRDRVMGMIAPWRVKPNALSRDALGEITRQQVRMSLPPPPGTIPPAAPPPPGDILVSASSSTGVTTMSLSRDATNLRQAGLRLVTTDVMGTWV